MPELTDVERLMNENDQLRRAVSSSDEAKDRVIVEQRTEIERLTAALEHITTVITDDTLGVGRWLTPGDYEALRERYNEVAQAAEDAMRIAQRAQGGAVTAHVHCDSDPIECGVEAMQAEYGERGRTIERLRAAYAELAEHHRQCELAGTTLAELVKRDCGDGGAPVEMNELQAAAQAWDDHQWPAPTQPKEER